MQGTIKEPGNPDFVFKFIQELLVQIHRPSSLTSSVGMHHSWARRKRSLIIKQLFWAYHPSRVFYQADPWRDQNLLSQSSDKFVVCSPQCPQCSNSVNLWSLWPRLPLSFTFLTRCSCWWKQGPTLAPLLIVSSITWGRRLLSAHPRIVLDGSCPVVLFPQETPGWLKVPIRIWLVNMRSLLPVYRGTNPLPDQAAHGKPLLQYHWSLLLL